MTQKVKITICDPKSEATSLMNLFPEDIAVYRHDQLPRNVLEPKGHERTYYHGLFSIIQRYSNMRIETVGLLPGIIMRMNKSRRSNDPYPALADLARKLHKMAKCEDRPNLETAARDIDNLVVLLGTAGRIRGLKNE